MNGRIYDPTLGRFLQAGLLTKALNDLKITNKEEETIALKRVNVL